MQIYTADFVGNQTLSVVQLDAQELDICGAVTLAAGSTLENLAAYGGQVIGQSGSSLDTLVNDGVIADTPVDGRRSGERRSDQGSRISNSLDAGFGVARRGGDRLSTGG
jgi:hypothetical protein